MRRRQFIRFVGGAMAAWPLAARSQEPRGQTRLIGVVVPFSKTDSEVRPLLAAFNQRFRELGWTEGHNVRIEYRFTAGNSEQLRAAAAELVGLAPDVILAHGASTVGPLLQLTRTIPIVFPAVFDPVGAGVVDNLARPGGNITGFMSTEYSMGGKWLELLKQIAPSVTRVAVFRDVATPTGTAMFGVIQAVAPSMGIVEIIPFNMRDAGEIEQAVTAFARSPNGGLVLTASGLAFVHRDLIISLAAEHKLPAVYYERVFPAAGGLISYGPDFDDMYRRAADYVDRILKGEKPGDLPVQAPTKYRLVINIKTAKTLGLDVPPSVLARADEVIE